MNAEPTPDTAGRRMPFVSVVIETITAREHPTGEPLASVLAPTIAAVLGQEYPGDRVEVLVVLDEANRHEKPALERQWPAVEIVIASQSNYFAAKNAGSAASRGDIVALLDADCVPDAGWLRSLVDGFTSQAAVVAGRTRYAGRTATARTFSVSDFANVVASPDGDATGFNLNNVAFRRDVIIAHPLDARVRRNGGCYLLYHTLKAQGTRIAYEPRAVVAHGLDVGGTGFIRKHFDRGYDGTNVYRVDDARVLRGTNVVRRFGPLGLVALTVRRIGIDWGRLVRDRHQIGVALWTVPYFGGVTLTVRVIELAGGLTAFVQRPAPARSEM
jgi:cellulose synthase/poly-beta-1,6-N-acetylglucosamine synthase-like glycosyltransferase